MTDDHGDLDPYLAELFQRPEPAGHTSGMDENEAIPISQGQLAHEAGKWFHSVTLPEVPAKLWLDYYPGGPQLYLRATFDNGGCTNRAILRLMGLSVALDGLYGTEILPVAYTSDHSWEDIEARAAALARVA